MKKIESRFKSVSPIIIESEYGNNETNIQINLTIKRPTRDACLCMGEATLPDPHFLFAIASQL